MRSVGFSNVCADLGRLGRGVGLVPFVLSLAGFSTLLSKSVLAEESLASPGATELHDESGVLKESAAIDGLEKSDAAAIGPSSGSGSITSEQEEWLIPPRALEYRFKPDHRPVFPKVNLLWVDSAGKLIRRTFKQKSRWTWVKNRSDSEGLSPVLRTLIVLPEGAEVQGFASTLLRKVDPAEVDWKVFLQSTSARSADAEGMDIETMNPARLLIVDTGAPQATGMLSIRRGGKVEDLGLVIRMGAGEPLYWSHSSCVDRGLVLGEPRAGGGVAEEASSEFSVAPFLYAAIHCRDEGGGRVRIHFSHSVDVGVQGMRILDSETGDWLAIEGDPTADLPVGSFLPTHEWILDPEKKPLDSNLRDGAYTQVAALKLQQSEGSEAVPQSQLAAIVRAGIWEGQVSSANRTGLTYSFGLSTSNLNYVEDEGDTVESSTIWLTLNAGVLWRFHPRWDVSLSGFINGITLAETQWKAADALNDANIPKFHGLNGRMGWRFSSPRGTLDWRLAGGIYYWGMSVGAGNQYGVQGLIGPQFFVSVRNNQRRSRPWGAYIKYALTGNRFGADPLEDREMAIGGEVQVGSLFNKAVSASMDISQAAFKEQSVNKSMSLSTISLGLKVNF